MSIIRNIRTFPVIAVLGVMTCWSSIATADPITVEFEISGFEDGATLSGSFTGEDTNNSGALAHGILGVFELTAFSLDWSGNSITAAFTQGLSDLRTLIYDIGGNTLLEFRSTQGGGFFSTPAAIGSPLFASVNGPKSGCILFCGDPDYQAVKLPGVTTTQVPEPRTLTLFGIGLLAAGFASRRRQV